MLRLDIRSRINNPNPDPESDICNKLIVSISVILEKIYNRYK